LKRPISFFLIFILLISCNNNYKSKDVPQTSEIDSIGYYITQSRNDTISLENRTRYIIEGIEKLDDYRFNDSVSNSLRIKFSYSAYKINDFPLFNKITNEIIDQSKLINDTLVLAKAYKYKGYYFLNKGVGIKAYSSFNTSNKLLLAIKDTISYAKNLTFLSCIQTDLHQYNGAENNMFEAIKIFSNNNMDSWLESCYNDLANLYSEKIESENAMKFFLKSKSLIASDDTLSLAISDNNIGSVFSKLKNYNKAIHYLEKVIIVKGLIVDDPQLYGRAKDNLTHAKFKNNLIATGIEKEFIDNYYFKQSIKDTAGIIANRLLITELYKHQKRKDKAIETASTALSLSNLSGNNTLRLKSYLMLMDVDSINNNKYSRNYIALKDSIDLRDRKVKNKLARIRMETDEYMNKAEILEEKNYMLIITIVALSLLILTIYFYLKQSFKINNLEKEQEFRDEVRGLLENEIVNIQKAKKTVNSNISKELHDNILSKLFGVRYNLEVRENADNNIFIETLKEIENEIRDISHELKSKSDSNLSKTVDKLLKKSFPSSNINYQLLNNFDKWNLISEDVKVNLYRIIQEAITNIAKHSRASSVTISFNEVDNDFILEIEDDGVGFSNGSNKKGIGISNIKDRVKEIDSTLEIFSENNKGTKLTIKTPVNANT